jgi:hypothetical protein
MWRYRGADKGNTNIALADSTTVLIADRDDLMIDSQTGSGFAHQQKSSGLRSYSSTKWSGSGRRPE